MICKTYSFLQGIGFTFYLEDVRLNIKNEFRKNKLQFS